MRTPARPWNGLGLVSSHANYLDARQREEWAKPGVYFLTVDGEDGASRCCTSGRLTMC